MFQVAWLRVDTQTILTIQNHVITKNHRVAITYSEKRTWQLKIKDIRESDRGWYMCQINTGINNLFVLRILHQNCSSIIILNFYRSYEEPNGLFGCCR